jgi:hypothetical protein
MGIFVLNFSRLSDFKDFFTNCSYLSGENGQDVKEISMETG